MDGSPEKWRYRCVPPKGSLIGSLNTVCAPFGGVGAYDLKKNKFFANRAFGGNYKKPVPRGRLTIPEAINYVCHELLLSFTCPRSAVDKQQLVRSSPGLSDDMEEKKRAAVVILPTEALPQGELQKAGVEQTLALTPIEFPENAKASSVVPLYILRKDNKTVVLVELVRFKSPFGSWFFVPEAEELVPDVCSNGDVTMVTRVDPLFCALILMDASREVGDKQVFQPLDALCITVDGTNLTGLCDTKQFEMLCDVKEAGGESFYKLNDEKAMSWLQAKHGALVRESNMKSADAVSIISQYVTARWGKQLRKQLLADVENVDSEAHKSAKNSHSLALATMMEDAVETNQAMLAEERDKKKGLDKWSVKKPVAKSKAVKKKKEKAPEASFWAAREKSLAKKRNLKRKKTSPK